MSTRRLVVALSGASGLPYGVSILRMLREQPSVETHLIISAGARSAFRHELDVDVPAVKHLADVVHSENNLASALASGSFRTMGMVVAPCSIKTLSAIAMSYSDNLVARAADVTLKERRRLVLMVRETPLHAGHLRLMADANANGAIIYPPMPAFYSRPSSVQQMVDHTAARVLDLFDIEVDLTHRWQGVPAQVDELNRPVAPAVAEHELG
jgi:flavin prenyltransferase